MVSKFLNLIIETFLTIRCFLNFHEWKYYKTEHTYEGLPHSIGTKRKPCGFEMKPVLNVENKECQICKIRKYRLINLGLGPWHTGKPEKVLKFVSL